MVLEYSPKSEKKSKYYTVHGEKVLLTDPNSRECLEKALRKLQKIRAKELLGMKKKQIRRYQSSKRRKRSLDRLF